MYKEKKVLKFVRRHNSKTIQLAFETILLLKFYLHFKSNHLCLEARGYVTCNTIAGKLVAFAKYSSKLELQETI